MFCSPNSTSWQTGERKKKILGKHGKQEISGHWLKGFKDGKRESATVELENNGISGDHDVTDSEMPQDTRMHFMY